VKEVNQHSNLILILLIPLKIQMLDCAKNINIKQLKVQMIDYKKNIKSN